MGANMARRLKDCGYSVTAVYDVHAESAANLAKELGCKHCTKLADVTAAADVIFTVVTNDASMRTIFLEGSDNLLTGAKGKVFINCATVTPGIHREVYAAAHGRPARTFPARSPLLRLDRIYVKNARHRPVATQRADWSRLSDHAPLAAEIMPSTRAH